MCRVPYVKSSKVFANLLFPPFSGSIVFFALSTFHSKFSLKALAHCFRISFLCSPSSKRDKCSLIWSAAHFVPQRERKSEALNLSSWKKMGFFCLSLSPALQFSSALSPSQGHHDAHNQREGHTLSDAASHFLVHSTERTLEISISP